MTPNHNRKKIKQGARLPYFERASIAPAKLQLYALHPKNSEGKADGFAALGYGPHNWLDLRDEILRRLPFSDATHADISNPDRLYFTVKIPLGGHSSRPGVVVTGWCIDRTQAPWLATLYAQPGRPRTSDTS